MNILLSIILSLVLALFALIKKAMSESALILAFALAIIITYLGGISAYLILVMVFLLVVLASKLKSNYKENAHQNINAINDQKQVSSIVCNVLPATVSLIIGAITSNPIFNVVYASLMAEAIADSMASDIGILSSKEPINILTLKKGTPGLSGNISILGISAAGLGSLIIALIHFIFNHSLPAFLIITISGFVGNLLDSFLGALLQAKYECPKCHIITEKEEHCSKKTKLIRGCKWLNNEIINLISNIIAGLLALLLLII